MKNLFNVYSCQSLKLRLFANVLIIVVSLTIVSNGQAVAISFGGRKQIKEYKRTTVVTVSQVSNQKRPRPSGKFYERKTKPIVAKPSEDLSSKLERLIFREINEKRAQFGLTELVLDSQLLSIARLHSKNMSGLNFFSHLGADGLRVDGRARSYGILGWQAIGENIAFSSGYEKPDITVVNDWMKSAGHRENLLNSAWRKTGIGVSRNSEGAYYLTQVFTD